MIIIFDIDGTLCRTSGVDDDCWRRAASDVLGVKEMTTDWGAYPHSTDEAIGCELIRRRFGSEADPDLLGHLRDRFVELLLEARAGSPDLFRPTPGAAELLRRLQGMGRHVAIATGGWRRSALLKLKTSGIPHDGLPAAFADDAHPRETIIRIARQRAADAVGLSADSLGAGVYVGDGLWDLRASGVLGMGFVGIAEGSRARALEAAGARTVMSDFLDSDRFVAALEASAT